MEPRWRLRFENFQAALTTLREAAAAFVDPGLTTLERDGFIQRFEYTWELGWKTMRDYLLDNGIMVAIRTAPNVIRAAFQIGLIDDGDAWIAAKNDRNVLAHEYGLAEAERIAADIMTRHLPLLERLETTMIAERDAGN